MNMSFNVLSATKGHKSYVSTGVPLALLLWNCNGYKDFTRKDPVSWLSEIHMILFGGFLAWKQPDYSSNEMEQADFRNHHFWGCSSVPHSILIPRPISGLNGWDLDSVHALTIYSLWFFLSVLLPPWRCPGRFLPPRFSGSYWPAVQILWAPC